MTAKLKIVAPEPERAQDITQLLRSDIRKRDWAACHIAGDKRAPVFLPERVRRLWRR